MGRQTGASARPRGRGAPATPQRFPLRAVAALFLERQHLTRPRGRRLGAAALARFAADTGGIQLDTINVVDRAHHLTLWNRFGSYDRATLERLLYRRRVLFEYWAHAACLVPATHFAMWRRVMRDYAERPRYGGWAAWAKRHAALIAGVEREIRARGPLANADFEHPDPDRVRTGWWDRKPAANALEYLWMSGRTMVHSRPHFQKRYDLTERLQPGELAQPVPDAAAFVRWHLRQSLRAMGAATDTDLRMYLTFPRIDPVERRRELARMLAEGEVVEVVVGTGSAPGGRPAARWLALAADLPALARAGRRRPASRGTALLAPFDSLLWHRDRARRLFGFDYTIEVYTPAPRRRYGYYTLPILHDGQLIGRLDPKTHREEGRLEIRSVHFEPWFAAGAPPPAASWGAVDRDRALAGIADTLASLALFVGADRVTVGAIRPRALAAPLRQALAARTDATPGRPPRRPRHETLKRASARRSQG